MQIAPGIQSLSQEQGGHVHAFLLEGPDGLTVIDTLYDDDGKIILDEIARLKKTPADLKHIILTHAHKSHLGGLAALKAATGAVVCAHDWEVDIIAGRREATRVSRRRCEAGMAGTPGRSRRRDDAGGAQRRMIGAP